MKRSIRLPGSNVPPAPTITKMPKVKKMTKYEDDCIGCPKEMGCIGNSCPYMNVPHQYCDICKEETDELWEHDGKEYCFECLQEELDFRKVEL